MHPSVFHSTLEGGFSQSASEIWFDLDVSITDIVSVVLNAYGASGEPGVESRVKLACLHQFVPFVSVVFVLDSQLTVKPMLDLIA
jgi:hypothetical protein